MDGLHYSFSLSACPKCHLLICKHTSLANLDFREIDQQEEKQQQQVTVQTNSKHVKNPYQRLSSHGMNFYILPSTQTTITATETTSNPRHSWTTFGTNSNESSQTLENLSDDHDTLSENIPFADELVVHSSVLSKPQLNQIVRTQSERCKKNYQPRICLTKSYSFSTIYTTPKSNQSLSSSPHIQQDKKQFQTKRTSYYSLFILSILILFYLLTNTLDIVLLYIYYHTNTIYFLIFASIIFTCDIILWMNNLIEKRNLSTRLLLIPFVLRFYLLYELVELVIILFNENNINDKSVFNVLTSSSSSSTTTTLETSISQTTDSCLLNSHDQQQREYQCQSYKNKKQRLYRYLVLFYLIHSSLLIFINLYFWSNNFQISAKSFVNMDYFIPQWITEEYLILTSAMNIIPVRAHPLA